MSFKALRIHSEDHGKTVASKLESIELEHLSSGEVVVDVHYSGLNYKDALAVTGKGRIAKKFPLVAGIDAAGIVESSTDERFHKGNEVVVTGCGIGEVDDGGFAQKLRVKAASLVHKPEQLSLKDCMLLGTAGFTAALALSRMEQNGQKPTLGPIVVTGASGGVGSFAVQILSQSGYDVIAVSGKQNSHSYLKDLGALVVMTPEQLALGHKPLETVRFGGGIDNVGGELLAKVLAHTQLWGNVASIGLADSSDLSTTVMPFILRGVSLLGASSNNTPLSTRRSIWQKLGSTWKPNKLASVLNETVTLDKVEKFSKALIERQIQGRVLVDLKSS